MKSLQLSTDMTSSVKIKTTNGDLYMMCGKDFQIDYQHYLLPEKKCLNGRLSLTFRLTAQTESAQGYLERKPAKIGAFIVEQSKFVSNISWDKIVNEIYPALEDDICKRGKEIFMNNGRKTAELLHPMFYQSSKKNFEYKYGGKTHIGQPMGPLLLQLTKLLLDKTHRVFDWCHVVFYPNGLAKIAPHADDEDEIAKGSDIACITFMEDKTESRNVLVKPMKGLKRKTM